MKKIFFIFSVLAIAAALIIAVYVFDLSPEYLKDWDKTPAVEITDKGSPYKHYYNELENREKHVYNKILDAVYEMPYEIRIPEIDAFELDRVFSALLYDNPDLIFLSRRCTLVSFGISTYCRLEYCMDIDEYFSKKEELQTACTEFEQTLSDISDEWQTEYEIHNFIIDNCEYKMIEDDHTCSSAYGVMINGVAACEGYSKAAKMLLDDVGIENYVVSGKAENSLGEKESHMWNVVKINGEFYHLDCTWDDPLKDGKQGPRIYSYFNLSDEAISKTHSEFSFETDCKSMTENYFVKTGAYYKSYSRAVENDIAALVAEKLDKGDTYIQIKFSSEGIYNDAVNDIIERGRIYNILQKAKRKTNVKFSMDGLSYYSDPRQCILTLEPELV